MIVGTTDAAKILNISTGRLRVLLIAGRVEGAYKSGKMWLMPLFNGKPIIKRCKRGPAPRWRNPRTPAKSGATPVGSPDLGNAHQENNGSRQHPQN